jgi:hypothetical protein
MSDITPLKQFEKDTLNRRPIHLLWRDCWKWIFDEFSCSLAHQQILDEIEYNIQAMCHFLVKNEHGFMQSTKDTLRLHQIDYKRYILCKEWFPECQDAKGKEKGQAALKANMEEFPEFYPSKKNPSRIEGFD